MKLSETVTHWGMNEEEEGPRAAPAFLSALLENGLLGEIGNTCPRPL